MDNSDFLNFRNNEHLGVNKLGKNIRKSPLHQPNYGDPNKQQPPRAQVYNIKRNDFRNVVQQLTGSPSRNNPPHNPPKPPSMRLQKIRPPPLTPFTQPPTIPLPAPVPPFNNSFIQPNVIGQQPSPSSFPPYTPGNSIRPNIAESPISAYMRYLHNSMINPTPQPQSQVQLPMSGLLPTPNGPALLPSPTSQSLLYSPSALSNLLSPQSSYPPLSPGFQYLPPLTPSFFSPLSRSGILDPGPQPPYSPGILFPSSPSGFFPSSSPKWRDY